MPDQFNYTGYFYTVEGYRLRSYLNIRKQRGWLGRSLLRVKSRIGIDSPDLMVVLMNPGASVPLEGGDDGRAECAAKPDLTQKQIARVMSHCGFSYARILNLSDLRYPESVDFLSELKPLDSKGIAHSIFDPARAEEFAELFVQSVPVILGWGVDERLRPLARRALEKIKSPVKVGQKKGGNDWAYYHPRQRGKDPQIWIDEILQQLN
jgi:hypothetical protein